MERERPHFRYMTCVGLCKMEMECWLAVISARSKGQLPGAVSRHCPWGKVASGRTCGLERRDLRAPRSLRAARALRSRRTGAGSGRRWGPGSGCWTAAPSGRGGGGVPGAEWPGGERAALVHHHHPVCGLPGAGESWGRVPPGPSRWTFSPPAHCMILGTNLGLGFF
jgi:hypothetical protein